VARSYLSAPVQKVAERLPGAQALVWHGEALLLRLFWVACRLVSVERASAFGGMLLRWIGPFLRQDAKIRRNLAIAFPHWDRDKLDATVTANWDNLGRVLAEYPHLGTICGRHWQRYIEVDSRCDLAGIIDGSKPAMMVSGHFGNWELAAGGATLIDVPITVIYSAQHNAIIDSALQRWRTALGCRFIEKDATVHALIAEVRKGRSMGVLMDQRYDIGDSVPFFGQSAPVPIAPASLAARLDLPFVPARIERLGGCRFRLTIEEPLVPNRAAGGSRDVARDLTARLYQRFETWIRERPEQWLCSKRRWPDLTKKKWREKLARNARLVSGADPAPRS
jgi:KDO2-lipid IV(A) lauroyltransferase